MPYASQVLIGIDIGTTSVKAVMSARDGETLAAGLEYEAATGRTADPVRAAGGDPDGLAIVAGVRFWF